MAKRQAAEAPESISPSPARPVATESASRRAAVRARTKQTLDTQKIPLVVTASWVENVDTALSLEQTPVMLSVQYLEPQHVVTSLAVDNSTHEVSLQIQFPLTATVETQKKGENFDKLEATEAFQQLIATAQFALGFTGKNPFQLHFDIGLAGQIQYVSIRLPLGCTYATLNGDKARRKILDAFGKVGITFTN